MNEPLKENQQPCAIYEMKKIVFMGGFDSVRDAETQSVDIFSTILPKDLAKLIGRAEMPSEVIDNVVLNYNKSGLEVVDDYLLYEGKVTQDEREIIVGALFEFANNI